MVEGRNLKFKLQSSQQILANFPIKLLMISGWGIVGWIIHRLPNSWRAKQRCLNIWASKPITSIHRSWITSSLYHVHVSCSKTDARGEDFTMSLVIQKMLLFAQNNWRLLWYSQFVYELFGQECELLRVMTGCHDRALSRVTLSRASCHELEAQLWN